MSHRILAAMRVPDNQVQYAATDGTVYKGNEHGLVHVERRHVNELARRFGFRLATTVPHGERFNYDQAAGV